jgi:hypothetical protein
MEASDRHVRNKILSKSILISLSIWAKTSKNGEEAAKLSNISLPIPLKTRG